MPVRAVLFDFDFTLADPSAWLLPAWVEALGAIGVPRPDDAALARVVGRPLHAQYSIIVGQPASGERFERFEAVYRRYRDDHAPAETLMLPAVPTVLERLAARGLMLGIVSTGAPSRLNAILVRTGLDRFFWIVEAPSHNKAMGILAAIKSLGVDAAATIYVGDHPQDCRAAADAKVKFLGVKTGVHDEADFPENTVVLRSIAELPAQLPWP